MKKLFLLTLIWGISLSTYSQNFNEYIGDYSIEDAPFDKVTVTISDGKLYGEAEGQGKAELKPTETKDKFEVVGFDGTLLFNRDNKDAIVSLLLSVQGNDMVGIKILTKKTLDEYLGVYVFEDAPIEEVKFEIREGKLFGVTAMGTAELKPTENKDKFDLIGYDGYNEFIRDDKGAIIKLKLAVQGNVMTGTKR